MEGDDHAIRVLPARFAPYLAVQLRGDLALFGPMNPDMRRRLPGGPQAGEDRLRRFWVPVHRLFSGTECLRGLNLTVALEARHLNEKIRRVHRQLRGTGWGPPDIDRPPFAFTDGIAELSEAAEDGEGILHPTVHPRLVEPAVYRERALTYQVPPDASNDWAPSLIVRAEGQDRHAPEYVHARHAVAPDGTTRDLGDEDDVAGRVRRGGYRARHYVDFTGDGWIEALCPELATRVPRRVPAYSLVTAPDFYPNCDQRELIEWWTERVPQALRGRIWLEAPPLTLADERLPPNLELRGVDFRPEYDTVSAIVSLPASGPPARQRPLEVRRTARHAHLPDGAASVFAPGWDTSRDLTRGVGHLAAYGLGSPFPEDAKLCAALSSYWPAVAPDAGRSFSRPFPTATPLTDEEIGSVGELPWDGVPGPRPVPEDDADVVEYARFDHVDYVRSALDGRFSLALTGRVDTEEYTARILAMARAYAALGVDPSRPTQGEPRDRRWSVLSFRTLAPGDGGLRDAQAQAGAVLRGARYRVELGLRGLARRAPGDHRKVRREIAERATLFVGPLPWVLLKRADAPWQLVRTP